MFKTTLIALVSLVIMACGGGARVKMDTNNRVEKKNVISLWVNELKDKDEKFDFRLNIKNETSDGMIVLLNDIQCYRGGVQGTVKHTFFNTGEKTMDFGAGQIKAFNLVCNIGSETGGDFKVVVARAFGKAPYGTTRTFVGG